MSYNHRDHIADILDLLPDNARLDETQSLCAVAEYYNISLHLEYDTFASLYNSLYIVSREGLYDQYIDVSMTVNRFYISEKETLSAVAHVLALCKLGLLYRRTTIHSDVRVLQRFPDVARTLAHEILTCGIQWKL